MSWLSEVFVLFISRRLMSMKTYSNENSFVIYLVPPLYIHIQGLNHPLTSGVKVHLSCSTAGARPIPQIVWTKGSQVMQGASQTVRWNCENHHQFHVWTAPKLTISTDICKREHHNIRYRLSSDTRRQHQSHSLFRSRRGEEQCTNFVDKRHENIGH